MMLTVALIMGTVIRSLTIPVGRSYCPINKVSWGIGWNWEQMEKDIQLYNKTVAELKHKTLKEIEVTSPNDRADCRGYEGCEITIPYDEDGDEVQEPITPTMTIPTTVYYPPKRKIVVKVTPDLLDEPNFKVTIGRQVCFYDPVERKQRNYVINTPPEKIQAALWGYERRNNIMVFWPKTEGCFHNGKGGLQSSFYGVWMNRPRDFQERDVLMWYLNRTPNFKLAWKAGPSGGLTTVQSLPNQSCQYFVNDTDALTDFMLGRSGLSLAWAKECFCASVKAPGYHHVPYEMIAGTISPPPPGPCKVTTINEELDQWVWRRMGSLSWMKLYAILSTSSASTIQRIKDNKGRLIPRTMIGWFFNYPDSSRRGFFQRESVLPYYFYGYPTLTSARGAMFGNTEVLFYNETGYGQRHGKGVTWYSSWGSYGEGAWTPIMGAWVKKGSYTHERINVVSGEEAAAQVRSELWAKINPVKN